MSEGFTDSAYYHFASADQNVEVKADNSTVVYVKYDLNTYKIKFNLTDPNQGWWGGGSNAELSIGGKTYSAGRSRKILFYCPFGRRYFYKMANSRSYFWRRQFLWLEYAT